MHRAHALLRRHAPARNAVVLPPVIMTDDYFGAGYGVASSASADAVARFGRCGFDLENTYSGKAAAAFLDRLATASGPVLFWNTFNSRPLPP
jgi:D-cysteine desulfhydrase